MQEVKDVLDTLFSRIETLAGTRTVVGSPMEVKGTVLVPFVEISIGVGAGGGTGEGEGNGTDEKGRQGTGKGRGQGLGTGGGLRVSPVAVLCVGDEGVSAYGLSGRKGVLGQLAELVPSAIEKAMETKNKGKASGEIRE